MITATVKEITVNEEYVFILQDELGNRSKVRAIVSEFDLVNADTGAACNMKIALKWCGPSETLPRIET